MRLTADQRELKRGFMGWMIKQKNIHIEVQKGKNDRKYTCDYNTKYTY